MWDGKSTWLHTATRRWYGGWAAREAKGARGTRALIDIESRVEVATVARAHDATVPQLHRGTSLSSPPPTRRVATSGLYLVDKCPEVMGWRTGRLVRVVDGGAERLMDGYDCEERPIRHFCMAALHAIEALERSREW